MRRCVLSLSAAAVALLGCATNAGITSEEEGRLVDACLAEVGSASCPEMVGLIVTTAEEAGCGYREASQALRLGLAGERFMPIFDDC